MSCHGLVKTLMFFINFIFSLIGVGIFVIGILSIVYVEYMVPVFVAPIAMIIGTIMFSLSISGCCGAIKEINCLLVMYMIAMALLAIGTIGVTVYLFMDKSNITAAIETEVNETNVDSDVFHGYEYVFKCCGLTGPPRDTNITISLYCCPIKEKKTNETKVVPCDLTRDDIYKIGCREAIPAKFESMLSIIRYSLVGITVFEILSIISAAYLACYPKKGGYDYD